MVSYTRCPKCGTTYESGKQHVCHVGGEEDLRKGKFEEGEAGPGIGGQD